MLIAGNCLLNLGEQVATLQTAEALEELGVDIFRCKLWGGGTTIEKYFPGIGRAGVPIMLNCGLPAITEVHTPGHVAACDQLAGIWIGARNSYNYSLLKAAAGHPGTLFIKRHADMTIDNLADMDRMIQHLYKKKPYWIERGLSTIDRGEHGRWAPDLKIAYVLKHTEPELFQRLVIDCSHSASRKAYVRDVYQAFKAVGVQHFMFEVFIQESKTDTAQVLSVDEFRRVLE